jgi:hypothetical protein
MKVNRVVLIAHWASQHEKVVLSFYATNDSSALEPDVATLRRFRTRGSIKAECQPEAAAHRRLRPATWHNMYRIVLGRLLMESVRSVKTTMLWDSSKQRVY